MRTVEGGAGVRRLRQAGDHDRPRGADLDVVAPLLVEEHGVLGEGGVEVDDGRERLVDDVDQLEGVLGDVLVAGDDGDDGLADVTDLLDRERAAVADLLAREVPQVALRADPLEELGAGGDGEDAVEGGGAAGVDRDDPCVRVRAAQDGERRLAREVDVVDVPSGAADEPCAVAGRDACADVGGALGLGSHDRTSVPCAASAASTALRIPT
ncbi:hypothetical protein GCM10009547_39330 [Sporichthya brevicatena]|uniref:Uncharacterized protein n=1 Tax=Sporichthya brevicatena TaxID=171442 RepID=A0ABN1H7G8_9ACTN